MKGKYRVLHGQISWSSVDRMDRSPLGIADGCLVIRWLKGTGVSRERDANSS